MNYKSMEIKFLLYIPPDFGKCGGRRAQRSVGPGQIFIFPTIDISTCACQSNLRQVALGSYS